MSVFQDAVAQNGNNDQAVIVGHPRPNLSVINNYKGTDVKLKPKSFKITVKNNSIEAIDQPSPNGWTRTPSKFPPGSSTVTWTNNSDIPYGEEINLGTIHFDKVEKFSITCQWINAAGDIIYQTEKFWTDYNPHDPGVADSNNNEGGIDSSSNESTYIVKWTPSTPPQQKQAITTTSNIKHPSITELDSNKKEIQIPKITNNLNNQVDNVTIMGNGETTANGVPIVSGKKVFGIVKMQKGISNKGISVKIEQKESGDSASSVTDEYGNFDITLVTDTIHIVSVNGVEYGKIKIITKEPNQKDTISDIHNGQQKTAINTTRSNIKHNGQQKSTIKPPTSDVPPTDQGIKYKVTDKVTNSREKKMEASDELPSIMIYIGAGSNSPSTTVKNDAYVTNTIGFDANIFIPIIKKKNFSFGFNGGGEYFINNNDNAPSSPNAFHVIGETSSTVAVTSLGSSKNSGFKLGVAPQVNFFIGKRIIISPMIEAGYMNMTNKSFSAVQTTNLDGNLYNYTLLSKTETKTSGFALIPKVRLNYMFTKNIGMWVETNYTVGPTVINSISTFIPQDTPDENGQYNIFQLDNGTTTTVQTKTKFSSFGVHAGLLFSIFDRWGNLAHDKPTTMLSCKNFKVNLVKNSKEQNKDGCCYDISITNNYNGLSINTPKSIRITVNNSTINSVTSVPETLRQTLLNPELNEIKWTYNIGNIPNGETKLGAICFTDVKTDPFYLTYELFDEKKKVVCKDSIQVTCGIDKCKNEVIRNGGFNLANVPGTMPSTGAVQYWTRGYGTPTVNNDINEGFIEQGCIKLSGNVNKGQAITQALEPNNKIIQGKHYVLSVAFRFKSTENSIDYAKIRAIAFNGNIYSNDGSHPSPSADVAIIGRCGKIHDCGDWSVIEFPVWTANKNFSNIAINAFTNDDINSSVWIDNIALCEAPQSDCNELQLDNSGSPIIPVGYNEAPPTGFTCQPEDDEDDYYNGSLQDLYPGYNGVTDSSFYSQFANSCSTIGGTLPPEVLNYNCDDNLKAEGIDMSCKELDKLMNKPFVPIEIKKHDLPIIPALTNNRCNRVGPKGIENMAFHGRDIIYIHGLQIDHLFGRAGGNPHATGHWPANANEYYYGYYKNSAIVNMQPHIDHFLGANGNLNRYLIVTYDCSESAEVAIHAVLTQIREAMENGTGVQFNSTDNRGKNCFGRDYVMISHSTGALVGDVLLSIANKTKTDENLKAKYGDIGLISDRCKGRVSIQGAFSGSNLAKIACQGASVLPDLFSIALTALSPTPITLQSLNLLGANTQIIQNSILVDLVPEITRLRWSSYINDITVPVFCLAGGHPSAILGSLKYRILPGFDDGVLNMDCVNGSNNNLSWGTSYFTSNIPRKVFDMGIPYLRARNYYLDQHHGMESDHFAAASTSYLSPTGMVEPVSFENISPQNHFNNHYSFIQSAKEHWFAATEPNISGNTNCDYATTSFEGSTNNEEVLVVNNTNLYSPSLINPSIISQVGETLREKHRSHRWIKITWRHGVPKASVYWVRFYYWKRTYHKLIDDCMYDADYAYKYLFTQ